MNLTITQDNTRTETINSSIIDKLYEIAFAASSDPNSTVSLTGRLESPKGYKYKIDWLNTEFSPNLTISTTIGLYMTFYDSNLQNVLKNTIGDGEGVLLNEFLAITNDSQLGLGPNVTAHPEITDFREGCLLTGLTLFNIGISALTGLTVFGFPPNVTNFSNVFASGLHFDGIVVKNWNNFINRQENSSWWENGYYVYDMDSNGNLTRIDTLTLPSNVTFPNDISWKNHLSGIKLEELVIPAGMTRFGLAAGNGIKKISFEPNSTLTTINFGFYLNDNISSSIVQLDVANLPLTITTIGNNAFRSCSNVTGVLDLPNLTSLGQYSFYSTGITSIADLGSITSVSGVCFNNCDSLTTVTLPNSCTSIDGGAFAFCDALTSIDLGGVTTIANLAFIADPALTTVTGTSNLTSIGNNAFLNCNLSGALDLSNVVTINSNAFSGCTALTSVTLSKLENINGENAFGSTGITQITLPNTLRKFDCRTFRNCAILKLVIPEGCLTITGGQDYSKNGTMRYLEIPSTVTDMDIFFHRAYENNAGSSIYLVIKATTPPKLGFYASYLTVLHSSYNISPFTGIYVPDSALSTYQDTTNLGDDQIGWKVAAVQAKLKPISLLLTDSPTWWAEYLTRANS